MKARHLVIGTVLGVVTALLGYLYSRTTTFALCSRDLEIVFVVVDAGTGEPIPNASIELTAEGWQEDCRPQKIATLITDENGTTRLVREKNSCEDVIRPFHKTITFIDLTWAVVNITAEGYSPIEQMWLHDAPKSSNEFIADQRHQRVGLRVPMRKQPGA
jgi:hypothetical protein